MNQPVYDVSVAQVVKLVAKIVVRFLGGDTKFTQPTQKYLYKFCSKLHSRGSEMVCMMSCSADDI